MPPPPPGGIIKKTLKRRCFRLRFLHLSDLHLGKRVCEFSMLDDQRYILEQVLSLLDAQPVDGVLLAGDLYDKPVPPAEAVRLLDWFLTELAARELPVFAVSGNHDSADRIAFGARLLAGSRVYVSPVFAAPPAPSSVTVLPAGERPSSVSERTKPLPSVFSPIRRPFLFTTVFTAPMIRAAGVSSSR